ncbi:MAG: PEP-CTERM sorting domain-containing protein [Pseudomonadota bacterium]
MIPFSAAQAGSAEFSMDWRNSSLTMGSGIGNVLTMGEGVSVDALIFTDNHGAAIGGGYPEWRSDLGASYAYGTNGLGRAVITEGGQSQVFIGNSNAAVIDLLPGARGNFRIPFAYVLDTQTAGDADASVSYSFVNNNYQLDGIDTAPVTITGGSFAIGAGTAQKGSGFIDILLDNPTDKLLRFSLLQSFSASASASAMAAVPEADTYAMLLSGLGLLAYVARRRRAR